MYKGMRLCVPLCGGGGSLCAHIGWKSASGTTRQKLSILLLKTGSLADPVKLHDGLARLFRQ